MNLAWRNTQRLYTQSYGGFGQNDVIVAEFTTGSTSTPDNNLSRVAAAEYAAGTYTREAVLSKTPCDFSAQQFQGASTSNTSVTVPFTVNNPKNFGYYPILELNTTYYYNIKNAANSGCTALASCDMAIDLANTTPVGVSALAVTKPSSAAIDAALKPPAAGYATAAKAALAKAKAKK